jgi:hypothetical protein
MHLWSKFMDIVNVHVCGADVSLHLLLRRTAHAQEYCNSQTRRLTLMRRLVADTLSRATAESNTLGNIADVYKMVPINGALKAFDLNTSEARRCLTDLLHNDEVSEVHVTTARRVSAKLARTAVGGCTLVTAVLMTLLHCTCVACIVLCCTLETWYQDMLAMLLTAQHALKPGEVLEETRHQEVEVRRCCCHKDVPIVYQRETEREMT